MEKRYQVFVSSTFEDLREERSSVIGALLQIDCIPSGMELFPATDDDSWTLIKGVIDDCDYYLVMVGGRYGSLHPQSSKSFTQMEYEYALEKGKPTIALLHSDPGSLVNTKCEQTEAGRNSLDQFRTELKKKNCRYWKERSELMLGVFTGLQQLKKTRPATGWVRSTELPEAAKDEILRLRHEIDDMQRRLGEAANPARPEDMNEFAQGEDRVLINVEYPDDATTSTPVKWIDIVRAVLPQTYGGGATPRDLAGTLVGLAEIRGRAASSATVPRSDYGMVMNQLVALGLVEARVHPQSPADTLWFATPYGKTAGSRMTAIKREEPLF